MRSLFSLVLAVSLAVVCLTPSTSEAYNYTYRYPSVTSSSYYYGPSFVGSSAYVTPYNAYYTPAYGSVSYYRPGYSSNYVTPGVTSYSPWYGTYSYPGTTYYGPTAYSSFYRPAYGSFYYGPYYR